MNDLVKSIQEGSYEISGGSLDPEAFHICLLALIMEVSGHYFMKSIYIIFTRKCLLPVGL